MREEWPDEQQRAGVCHNIWRNRDKSEGKMEIKNFIANLKQVEGEGKAIVVFATLNTIDKDEDVTIPGAFGMQTAKIAGAHDWMGPGQGIARIHEDDKDAIAELQYNLKMQSAQEWYQSLKFNFENGVPQEYSYAFDILEESKGEFEARNVRFLKKLKVHEVSPVMVGAGIDTRTLAVKNQKKTLEQEFDEVLDALTASKEFTEREQALAALRQKEGRTLSRANRDRLGRLLNLLNDVQGDIDKLLRDTERSEEDEPKAYSLFARYQQILARISGHI